MTIGAMPKSTDHHPPRRLRSPGAFVLPGLALLSLLTALTACGGGSGTQSGAAGSGNIAVASLPATSAAGSPGQNLAGASGGADTAGASGAATDPASGRPQERLDDTTAFDLQLWSYYYGCLQSNGVKMNFSITTPGMPSYDQPAPGQSVPAAALAACQSKMPLEPPQMNPQLNPQYAADMRADVKCINSKGLKVVADADGGGWTFDGPQPNLTAAQLNQIQNECQEEAFSGNNQ